MANQLPGVKCWIVSIFCDYKATSNIAHNYFIISDSCLSINSWNWIAYQGLMCVLNFKMLNDGEKYFGKETIFQIVLHSKVNGGHMASTKT